MKKLKRWLREIKAAVDLWLHREHCPKCGTIVDYRSLCVEIRFSSESQDQGMISSAPLTAIERTFLACPECGNEFSEKNELIKHYCDQEAEGVAGPDLRESPIVYLNDYRKPDDTPVPPSAA